MWWSTLQTKEKTNKKLEIKGGKKSMAPMTQQEQY